LEKKKSVWTASRANGTRGQKELPPLLRKINRAIASIRKRGGAHDGAAPQMGSGASEISRRASESFDFVMTLTAHIFAGRLACSNVIAGGSGAPPSRKDRPGAAKRSAKPAGN